MLLTALFMVWLALLCIPYCVVRVVWIDVIALPHPVWHSSATNHIITVAHCQWNCKLCPLTECEWSLAFPCHLLYILRMTRILSEFKFCRSQHRKIMCSIIWLSGVCCFVNIAACSLFHFLHAPHNYHLSDTLMSNSGVYNHSLLILYQIYIILEVDR